MSVSKDKSTGKWMVQWRVKDLQGKVIHKKKRGFKTKKEAQEWEVLQRIKVEDSSSMLFSLFIELYFQDMQHRVKKSTYKNKIHLVEKKVTPFFGHMKLNSITPKHIRDWQNLLTSYRDEKGNPYSQTYLKTINNQITAIFNYAVKYYDLKENPCHKAGGMGKKNADEMLFWVKEEFDKFIECIKDKPQSYTAFMLLYYTGIRSGELAALTRGDINLEKLTITINKFYQRIDKEDIITTPKTPKSNRVVTIPQKLADCLEDYFKLLYGLKDDDRIFPFTRHFLNHEMKRGCKLSGVKKIRVHDLRHSHASLLIEMGFSPLLIAERLGHEKIETTLNTYSHLYPNKQVEIADKLNNF